jgi:hypothetical protein
MTHNSSVLSVLVMTMVFLSFLIAFWQVMALFRFPHEPLAPLWVARLCRAKYCNCNCYPQDKSDCHGDHVSDKCKSYANTMDSAAHTGGQRRAS